MLTFRHPAVSLLIPGQISGTSAAHNDSVESLKNALLALHADSAAAQIALYGAGRIVSSWGEHSMRITADAGLAVRLIDATWMIGGLCVSPSDLAGYIAPDDDEPGYLILPNVPGAGTWYGYLALQYDDEYSVSAEWFNAVQPELTLSGQPCIGAVTTDSNAVLSIDYESEDIIVPNSVLQSQLIQLIQRVGVLENSGSNGSGGGGWAYTGLAPWLPSPNDSRPTAAVIEELIALAVAAVGNGAVRENPELRQLLKELGAQGIGITELNPEFNHRSESTTIVIGVHGDGSHGSIDDLEEGTATIDEDTATIGP